MLKVISCHLTSYAIVTCVVVIVVYCLLEMLIRIRTLEKLLSPPYPSDVESMRTSRNVTTAQEFSFR